MGAPQARLSELAKRFVARGHEVTVVTAMPNYPTGKIHAGYGGLLRREEHYGARVIRTFIYPTQRADFLHRLSNYFSFVFSSAFFGTFLLGRTDFIIVESPPLFLGLAGYWLSRLKRARLIFNVSDLWPDSVVRLGKLREGSRGHRCSLWLEKFCYGKAWLVSGQSAGILQDIRRRFPSMRQFHLSNGVDPKAFNQSHRSEQLRQELGKGRSCLAIYAGLHGLAQGLDQILAAADRLRDLSELAIILVGDGPEKEDLQRQAIAMQLPNVQFLPARPRGEMAALAASADIALVTLKMHLPGAVPSKIYEAMGVGVPVLLVADGEPAEIIRRTECGLVTPMNDAAALAEALRKLVADPALRRTCGENGRRAAETEFNRDIIVSRFIDYLEKAIAC